MSLKIFLDLDRTLYKTDLGTQLIWQEIARRFPGINDRRELGRQNEFYVFDGDSYAYDMRAHLTSLGLDADRVMDYLSRSEIADGRLEYEGANELVSWAREVGEVAILTYGYDDYQRMKASLCPSINGVEIITTLKPKGDFFKTIQGEAWLVDDKPIGDELPEHVRFVQLLHSDEGEVSPDESSPWYRVDSLRAVLDILQKN